MTIKIGINGLGRIGRCVLRAIYETNSADIELVAVNGPASLETHLHLLKYDSVHGRFNIPVVAEGGNLKIDGKEVRLFREKNPENIPWQEAGADVIFECTGKFNKRDEAARHLTSGAKKVLISAPAEDADATIVYGVNNEMLLSKQQVISVGSCTTNALAPLVKILHETVGIEAGFMTTIHSYTGDQNLVDSSHKDLRRARAAALSMIPTSTGAAKTISLILPELKGRLDGTSIRVPTANVSLVDLSFTASKKTSAEEINSAFKTAAGGKLRGVLDVSSEPLVSIDFTHNSASSIVDLTATQMVGDNFCRVASWYDNEWAFSCRMLDVARLWNKL